LYSEGNETELQSVQSSSDSEEQPTPTHFLKYSEGNGSPMSQDTKPSVGPLAGQSFHQYFTASDVSSETSNESSREVPHLLLHDEVGLSQSRAPEVFVCQFDEEYSPETHYTAAPKHATMLPTNLLQVPTKNNINTNSLNSMYSSKYMTPYGSVNSLLTNHSLSSSQESIGLDYEKSVMATRKRLLCSRRKSLSENNLAALCQTPSLLSKRHSNSNVSIVNQSSNNACQVKIADDVYNLHLPKPLKNKISRCNSYLAISVSRKMIRNKHGESTDV